MNTEDRRKITGLVEALDGLGNRESFTDIDELSAILNRSSGRPRRKRKKSIKSD
uniref:Uncharacterized protein n=1 Tax=uncultured Desulfobacterium sp. TaxID=201089 RepID=E1YAP2_9BACT|nr:unknown protein [uncultured Desulfobacterium sp.]